MHLLGSFPFFSGSRLLLMNCLALSNPLDQRKSRPAGKSGLELLMLRGAISKRIARSLDRNKNADYTIDESRPRTSAIIHARLQ
jgi:hypothetical protein